MESPAAYRMGSFNVSSRKMRPDVPFLNSSRSFNDSDLPVPSYLLQAQNRVKEQKQTQWKSDLGHRHLPLAM